MSKIQGVHIPADFKNLAINGAFDFWQRIENTTATVNTATAVGATYGADMFSYQSGGTTVKNYSVNQSTGLPTLAQSGFESAFSYAFTMVTGITSPAAGDYVLPCNYRMEGNDYQRIHSKTITVGFWFVASIAGTYSLAIGNSAGTRSYVTTFTFNTANTWQYISTSITLDSTANTGSWTFTNALGMIIYIAAVTGSTFATSTLNAWQALLNFLLATGTTNYQATTGATINIAQFSIAEGSLGLGAKGFQRQGKSIQQELALCQRYYEKSWDVGTAVGTAGSVQGYATYRIGITTSTAYRVGTSFAVRKSSLPTTTFYSPQTTNASGKVQVGSTDLSVGASQASTLYLWAEVTATNGNPLLSYHWTADAGL